jgi:hypothetical protein
MSDLFHEDAPDDVIAALNAHLDKAKANVRRSD